MSEWWLVGFSVIQVTAEVSNQRFVSKVFLIVVLRGKVVPLDWVYSALVWLCVWIGCQGVLAVWRTGGVCGVFTCLHTLAETPSRPSSSGMSLSCDDIILSWSVNPLQSVCEVITTVSGLKLVIYYVGLHHSNVRNVFNLVIYFCVNWLLENIWSSCSHVPAW